MTRLGPIAGFSEQGLTNYQIGWFGESAGGGLTLAAMHALKQQGLAAAGCNRCSFTLDGFDAVQRKLFHAGCG